MGIWFLRPFGVFNDLLVDFVVTLVYFFSIFGLLYREKSGNPAPDHKDGHLFFRQSKSRDFSIRFFSG
jgi:hypothetical protein